MSKVLWITCRLGRSVRQNDPMRTDGLATGQIQSRRRAAIALLTLVVLGSGAGCTPEPGPTPTPTPTFTCTATVGACTPQQAEKEAKASKDHAAAKSALQAGVTEIYRILAEGGASKATPELKRYLAEDELNSAVGAIKRFEQSKRVGHGSVAIAGVTFETTYPDSRQEVVVCEDATRFYTTDRAGKNRTPPGVKQKYSATLKLLEGQWKLTQSTDSVKVASCGG